MQDDPKAPKCSSEGDQTVKIPAVKNPSSPTDSLDTRAEPVPAEADGDAGTDAQSPVGDESADAPANGGASGSARADGAEPFSIDGYSTEQKSKEEFGGGDSASVNFYGAPPRARASLTGSANLTDIMVES